MRIISQEELNYSDAELLDYFAGFRKYIDNGHIVWRKDGEIARDFGPAIIYSNGDQFYIKRGKYIGMNLSKEDKIKHGFPVD